MTLKPRADKDWAALPDYETERAVLADFTDPRSTSGEEPGFDYERTLGDLIVDALVGHDLYQDQPFCAEEWEPFERALLKRTALELKALNHVLAVELTTDDHAADTMNQGEICELVRGITRRAQAGAELAARLRQARWGHPNFGGGDNYAVRLASEGIRLAEREDLRLAAIDAARNWTRTREGKPGEFARVAFDAFWETWSKEQEPRCTREQAFEFYRAMFKVAAIGGTGHVREPMSANEDGAP